ncbi:DUF4263 domain-containing protein [Pseudoxanthomonas mexicana]|uniref:DUF4263 domain-containing protein n=1 Tax=Pseudoxanthomonas mexicana TaxID=128785 RepID=A0A7G9TD67_PSEMX|nr:Shedu anti-phage system protein SduA domain-containing protein [Pseudoxanthomonas mexicana]QNN78042.1 DUF4263 domain-containing protein [Pseudoxanthomonas mexicana]
MTNQMTLLDVVNGGADEPDVQNFFEKFPEGLTGSIYLLGNVVIRKFKLGADYIPDFAYVQPMSGRTYMHLVEIESPKKNIFTQNDEFTKEFNQALQQVRDWMQWVHQNSQTLMQQIEPLRVGNYDTLYNPIARGTLIFGRRGETEANQRRRERWAGIKDQCASQVSIYSYDGIAEANQKTLPPNLGSGLVHCVAYQGRDFVRIAHV